MNSKEAPQNTKAHTPTPGPWSVHPYTGGGIVECADFTAHTVCIGAGDTLIAEVVAYKHRGESNGWPRVADFDENRANAALMIAAPDLLEALQEYMATCPADEDTTVAFIAATRKARAAIAKALGGAA